MKTLDRYVIRSFLWSVLMLLVAMLALRIVADLFINMDEFVEDKSSFLNTLQQISHYYTYQSLMYITELGGSVITVAAAFTMARMNHTNELTAMLASGVSLHRVILPVVIGAVLLNGLIILDREVLIPANTEHLLRSRDESREVKTFPVYLAPDGAGDIWWSPRYDPNACVMSSPMVAVRQGQEPLASIRSVSGKAVPDTFKTPDGKSIRGWDITSASLSRETGQPWINTPTTDKVYTHVGPMALLDSVKQVAREAGIDIPPDSQIPCVSGLVATADEAYGMTVATGCPADGQRWQLTFDKSDPNQPWGGTLAEPVFTFTVPVAADKGNTAQRIIGIVYASKATWVHGKAGRDAEASHWLLTEGRLFFPSDLTDEDLQLRQKSRWLDLMSLSRISQLLDGGKVPDRQAAILAKHTRVADPINNIILLLLGLPFILSRERNIKASAGLAVLMTGSYFAFIHGCRLVGLPPMVAAFLPIIVFGAVAAVMMDSIKT